MRGRSTGRAFLAIGSAFFSVTAAWGAGFTVNNKSVSALGAGLAGQAALAEDASTVFNNPAGMIQLEGRQVSGGLHRISTTAAFSNEGSTTTGNGDDTASVEAWVPTLYYVQEAGPDLRAGIGFYSPFGLGLNYDDGWTGRYHSIKSSLRTYNMSPAVAWRVTPELALGASVEVQHAEALMTKAIDFNTLCGGCGGDGYSRLTGDSWAWGYSLGATWTASPATRLGAVFHSGMRQELTGRATFSNVPAVGGLPAMFADTDGKVAVNLPWLASVSAAWDANDSLTLLADYTRTGWSTYRELRIEFSNPLLADSVTKEGWRDASRYNLGVRYRLNPAWLLRAGFSYDETPVPDAEHRTPTLPDCDRRWYSIGARWESAPDLSVDMAFAWMNTRDVPIQNTDSMGHTLRGTYEVTSSFVGVQGNWRF